MIVSRARQTIKAWMATAANTRWIPAILDCEQRHAWARSYGLTTVSWSKREHSTFSSLCLLTFFAARYSTRLVRIRDYNGTRGRTNMEEEFLPYLAIILPQQVQPIVRDVCADGHEFWVAWFDGRGKPISGLELDVQYR